MQLDKKLKAFVRYDGSQRVVPGSLILRKNKPKVGTWKEVSSNYCCDGIGINHTPSSLSIANVDLTLTCSSGKSIVVNTNTASTNMVTLLAALNASAGYLGVFTSPNGTTVNFVVNTDVANTLCYGATLSFSVA
jgi:hypothetical protein